MNKQLLFSLWTDEAIRTRDGKSLTQAYPVRDGTTAQMKHRHPLPGFTLSPRPACSPASLTPTQGLSSAPPNFSSPCSIHLLMANSHPPKFLIH